MSAESDIAAIDDGGANTAAEVRTALTSVLTRASRLDVEKSSSDTPDDDFNGSTLDVKWTAAAGSSGTVDPFDTTATLSKYDLTTRSDGLLIQHNGSGGDVGLRQDYTLPNGNSIILALNGPLRYSAGNSKIGIVLNSTDSAADSGTGYFLGFEQDGAADTDIQALYSTGISAVGNTWNGLTMPAKIYLRIARIGTTNYAAMLSPDGNHWVILETRDQSVTFDNVWIWAGMDSSATYAPIAAVDWIRQGSNNFDPW